MVKSFSQYAVLGSPISHSLSPLLYNSAARACGLDYNFSAIEVDVESFAQFIDHCDASWGGFSVTMPNKIAALAYAACRSESAQLIGAANTLWKNEQGVWCAENTDVDGVLGAFQFVGLQRNISQQKLLILGAGGTARAVVYAARDYAEEIIFAVRNPSRAVDLSLLATRLGMKATIIELNSENLIQWCPESALVISTLPRGAADSFAEEIALSSRLFDVLYHPWPTPIVEYCIERSNVRLVGGITMLLYQAFSQFRFLIGAEPPCKVMAEALSEQMRIPLHEFCFE